MIRSLTERQIGPRDHVLLGTEELETKARVNEILNRRTAVDAAPALEDGVGIIPPVDPKSIADTAVASIGERRGP